MKQFWLKVLLFTKGQYSLFLYLLERLRTFLIFLLLQVILVTLIYSQSPAKYNRKGLYYLKNSNLEKAEFYFRKALILEPGDHVANYNLSCTLALRLKENYCEFQSSTLDIYGYLSNSVKAEPNYKTKVLTDTDFDVIKNKIGFYESLGYDIKKRQDAKTILVKVDWFGSPQGVYGPGDGLDFQFSGKLVYWYLDSQRLAYDEVKKKLITGTYYWKGNRLVIRFRSKLPHGRRDYYGEIKDHKLWIYGLHEFTDDAALCSE